MLKNILLKTLRDRRKSLLWWSLGLALYAIFITYFYPTFTKEKAAIIQLTKLYQDMPLIKLFTGETVDFASPEGFLNTEFFFAMGPLVFIIFAISFGSDAIAGEEERRTLDLLLSNPVPRSKVVLEKFLAMALSLFIVILATYIGFVMSLSIFNIEINLIRVAEATLSCYFLSLAFGSLALAIGCISGNKGTSIGVPSTIAFMSYLINALSPMVSLIENYRIFSLFYYYAGRDPLKNGIYIPYLAVIILFALICLVIALVFFEKRDIKI